MDHKISEERMRSPIYCCFRSRSTHDLASADDRHTPSLRRSSSTWFRSKANEIPDLKVKCRGFISRMGRPRRHPGGDFRYDPLSYALNFDEGLDFDDLDGEISPVDFRHRNFSSRLPASPSHPLPSLPPSPLPAAA